jgi:hypothetical protein
VREYLRVGQKHQREVGSYRRAVGFRIIDALDSRGKSTGLALLIGLLFGSVQFGLLVGLVQHAISVHNRLVVQFVITSAGVAAISYFLLLGARARRIAVLEHVRKVAELNHNIRNALQIILASQYVSTERTDSDRKLVVESVERIDTTLQHLFPVVGERKSDGKTPPTNARQRMPDSHQSGPDRRKSFVLVQAERSLGAAGDRASSTASGTVIRRDHSPDHTISRNGPRCPTRLRDMRFHALVGSA